jgi:hypothetical protein
MALLAFHVVGAVAVWRAATIEQPGPNPSAPRIEVPA